MLAVLFRFSTVLLVDDLVVLPIELRVDEMPIVEPLIDEPPIDEPPIDDPPIDKLPIDEPPIVKPPPVPRWERSTELTGAPPIETDVVPFNFAECRSLLAVAWRTALCRCCSWPFSADW